MEKRADAKLQLHISASARPLWRGAPSAALTLLLYIALSLSFSSIAGTELSLPALIAGIAVLLADAAMSGKKRLYMLYFSLFAIGTLAALLLFSPAREGVKLLCNRVFEASEAVNAYAYDKLTVSDAANVNISLVLLSLFAAAYCSIAVLCKSRVMVVLLFVAIVGTEAYFGVTPNLLQNLVLFLALGLALLGGRSGVWPVVFLFAGVVLIAAVVFTVAPGVNLRLETWSESLRDRLDVFEQNAKTTVSQSVEELMQTHRENRLDEQFANGVSDEEQNYQDYERQEKYESEISRPERTNYLIIIWMSLLILSLLVLPFLPFIILDSRRRRAAVRRLELDSEDNGAAIRAMFLQMMAWFETAGLKQGNRLFSDCGTQAAAHMDEDFLTEYENAVALWQEAAYSGHCMTEEQRECMRRVLEKTENRIYGKAGLIKKFKLKYIDCLAA